MDGKFIVSVHDIIRICPKMISRIHSGSGHIQLGSPILNYLKIEEYMEEIRSLNNTINILENSGFDQSNFFKIKQLRKIDDLNIFMQPGIYLDKLFETIAEYGRDEPLVINVDALNELIKFNTCSTEFLYIAVLRAIAMGNIILKAETTDSFKILESKFLELIRGYMKNERS